MNWRRMIGERWVSPGAASGNRRRAHARRGRPGGRDGRGHRGHRSHRDRPGRWSVLEFALWSDLRSRLGSGFRSGTASLTSAGRRAGSFAARVTSRQRGWVSSSPLGRIRLRTSSAHSHSRSDPVDSRRRRLASGLASRASELGRALAASMHPRSAESRRRRTVVGAAAGLAMIILVVSFPLSTLLSQHRQLTAAAAQLATVRQENRQLREQEKQLSSKTEIERRARQDYQLVEPGQTLFELLPGPGSQSRSDSSAVGDPADQPLVPPSRAPDLTPDPGLPTVPAPASHGGPARSGGHSTSAGTRPASSPPSSFWSRVANTLEFWK